MLGIGLSSCCLTLLLTIIQLYRGGQFLLLEETGVPEKTIRNQTIYLYKVILCTRQGPSWPLLYGKLDLQLLLQSEPITTDVVSSNLDQEEVYNIM
jgi:hypothetical protein